jgi:hypothetical protein
MMGMSPQRWGYDRKVFAGASGRSRRRAQALLKDRFDGADFPSKEETAAALIDILGRCRRRIQLMLLCMSRAAP